MAVKLLKKGDVIRKVNESGSILNEYRLTSDFSTFGGARSESATAVDKDGRLYFVKKLTNYVFASDPKMMGNPATKKQHERAREYVNHQAEVYQKLEGFTLGGTLVVRDCAVIEGNFCYNIFPYVENQDVKVCELPMDERLRIVRLAAQGIQNLHRQDIVHADLKPQNVLLERGKSGHYTPKIIDFDDSFFEGNTPLPTDLVSTEEYYSPELAIYYFSEGKKSFGVDATCITRKTDIFTLGVIFCGFLTGGMPEQCEAGSPIYGPILNAIPKRGSLKNLKGKEILTIPEKDAKGNPIPAKVRDIVNKMLLPWYEERPTITEVCSSLSMAGASVSPVKLKPIKRWKCKHCDTVNDLNKFVCCKCRKFKPLNPEYVIG